MRKHRDHSRHRRARHLVVVSAVALCHAGLARRDRRSSLLLSDRYELHRARHHQPLGQPDDHDRARVHGRGSFFRCRHPLPGAGGRRAADVEVLGHRRRPAQPDRQVRDGRPQGVGGFGGDVQPPTMPEPDELELVEDRWMASRLASAQREVTDGIEGFAFQDSMAAAYGSVWHEFCDWWLEAAKDRLRAKDKTAQAVALFCLDNLLRLLHPFMPFLTEELWSRLPGERDYLMRAPWPEDLHRYVDGQAEFEFESLMQAVNEIRSYRKTTPGAPAKGSAVRLGEPMDSDWARALSLLGLVAVVDELPPGKELALTEGSVVFPAVAAPDPAVIAKKKAEYAKEFD